MSGDKLDRVPLAVARARDHLSALGLEITPENITQHLDKAEINKLMGCMRTSLKSNKEASHQFVSSTDHKSRREYLAAFLLEPDVSKCQAFNRTSKENVSGFRGKKVWLTLSQMASPAYFNSVEDAELIAKDCPERAHELPSMAAQGKKQYEVELTEEIWERLNKEKVEVNARADLKASDYEKIKEQMEMDMPRKIKPKKMVAVETSMRRKEGSKQARKQAKVKQMVPRTLSNSLLFGTKALCLVAYLGKSSLR